MAGPLWATNHSAKDQADKLAEPLGRHTTVAVGRTQVTVWIRWLCCLDSAVVPYRQTLTECLTSPEAAMNYWFSQLFPCPQRGMWCSKYIVTPRGSIPP